MIANSLKLKALAEKFNVINKPYKVEKQAYQKAAGTIIRAGYYPKSGKPIVR